MTTSTGTGRRDGRISTGRSGGRIPLILAGTALVCAALVAASALAAPPLSETTKAKMAVGHWAGGGPGMAWQPEPDRPYVYNPPLARVVSRKASSGRAVASTLGLERPIAAMTQIDERTLAGRRGAARPLAAAAEK